jgi:hypothetical protein
VQLIVEAPSLGTVASAGNAREAHLASSKPDAGLGRRMMGHRICSKGHGGCPAIAISHTPLQADVLVVHLAVALPLLEPKPCKIQA